MRQWLVENTNDEKRSGSLKEVLVGADVFVGVSAPNILDGDDIANMASEAIVFGLANPIPEVDPLEAQQHAAVVATGRSDFPNQINNVLAFPGFFRGLLDGNLHVITDEMLSAAANAIADQVAPDELNASYIIPSVFDASISPAVAAAVRHVGGGNGSTSSPSRPLALSLPRSFERNVRNSRCTCRSLTYSAKIGRTVPVSVVVLWGRSLSCPRLTAISTIAHQPEPSITLPGVLLGIGLGGFVDGIVLHQVLQWHHLLSSTDTDRIGLPYFPVDTVAGLEVNTLWDGLFHSVTWVAVVIGLAVLWRRVRQPRRRLWASRVLWGWVLFGWGAFNLVEGLINHHLLAIHHVREGPGQLAYDLGFLVFGALLLAGGYALQRSGRPTGSRSASKEVDQGLSQRGGFSSAMW